MIWIRSFGELWSIVTWLWYSIVFHFWKTTADLHHHAQQCKSCLSLILISLRWYRQWYQWERVPCYQWLANELRYACDGAKRVWPTWALPAHQRPNNSHNALRNARVYIYWLNGTTELPIHRRKARTRLHALIENSIINQGGYHGIPEWALS